MCFSWKDTRAWDHLVPEGAGGQRQMPPPPQIHPSRPGRAGPGDAVALPALAHPSLRLQVHPRRVLPPGPARGSASLSLPWAHAARGWGSRPHRHGDIIRHRQPRELTSLRLRGRRSRNSREGWAERPAGVQGGCAQGPGAGAEGSRASFPLPFPTCMAGAEAAAGGGGGCLRALGAAQNPAAQPWVPLLQLKLSGPSPAFCRVLPLPDIPSFAGSLGSRGVQRGGRVKSKGGFRETGGGQRDAQPWAWERARQQNPPPPGCAQQAAEGFASAGDERGHGHPGEGTWAPRNGDMGTPGLGFRLCPSDRGH